MQEAGVCSIYYAILNPPEGGLKSAVEEIFLDGVSPILIGMFDQESLTLTDALGYTLR
jgi:hypothetical protein